MIRLMQQFMATFIKDILVLWRDRAGMLVLFVMPMALVLIVSLVQNNVLQATGQSALQVLFVDEDGGEVGQQLRTRLKDSGAIALVETMENEKIRIEGAREEVKAGNYQFGILIPAGSSDSVAKGVDHFSSRLFSPDSKEQSPASSGQIELFFDPTVQGAFRSTVLTSLRYALLGLEMEMKGQGLSRSLQQRFSRGRAVTEESNLFTRGSLLTIKELSTSDSELRNPDAIQQNVPAWSLFGMFFIVVPLSAALLRERQEGTLLRLFAHPVPYEIIVAGKTAAYVVVCLIQFSLMLAAGRWILPLFGTPTLLIGDHPGAVFLLALCAALAATGYGLLLGAFARSYDQASMLGAVSVVIAAAIGGIMVPTYVMPTFMKTLSGFSPLAWGLEGFVELFVRGGDLHSILANMGLLLGFFLGCLLLSRLVFSWRYGKGTL